MALREGTVPRGGGSCRGNGTPVPVGVVIGSSSLGKVGKDSVNGSSPGVGGNELSTVETELMESFCPPRMECRVTAPLSGLGMSFKPSDPPSAGNPGTLDAGFPGLLIRRGKPSIGRDVTNACV